MTKQTLAPGFEPPTGYTIPTLQIYLMDNDGSNVTPIWPMTIGSALHPTPLVASLTNASGRLYAQVADQQGNVTRVAQRFAIHQFWTAPNVLFVPWVTR